MLPSRRELMTMVSSMPAGSLPAPPEVMLGMLESMPPEQLDAMWSEFKSSKGLEGDISGGKSAAKLRKDFPSDAEAESVIYIYICIL